MFFLVFKLLFWRLLTKSLAVSSVIDYSLFLLVHIWKARNDLQFKGKDTIIHSVLHTANAAYPSHALALCADTSLPCHCNVLQVPSLFNGADRLSDGEHWPTAICFSFSISCCRSWNLHLCRHTVYLCMYQSASFYSLCPLCS